MLGRRGPAQAAFDQGELEAIADLRCRVRVDGEVSFMEEAVCRQRPAKSGYLARLTLEPQPSKDRGSGCASWRAVWSSLAARAGERAVRIADNRLLGSGPHVRAEPTGETWELAAGLVIRSVGYRGAAVPGLPFDARRNVIPSSAGRVTNLGGEPQAGLYCSGWIKRGPTGLVGTNKADSRETVELLLRDAEALRARKPTLDVDELLAARGVRIVTFADYQRIDAAEKARGAALGKVRDKFERVRTCGGRLPKA